jgi:hypothetical protein
MVPVAEACLATVMLLDTEPNTLGSFPLFVVF